MGEKNTGTKRCKPAFKIAEERGFAVPSNLFCAPTIPTYGNRRND
jgi:hypothetical protein